MVNLLAVCLKQREIKQENCKAQLFLLWAMAVEASEIERLCLGYEKPVSIPH